jgi:predicted metal-dependent peptidase
MAGKTNILEVYNICRELVNQAEASALINNGKVDEKILPPLKEAFEQVIEFEKVHLIMAQDVFWGSVLVNMTTKVNFNVRGPLDIDVSKEPLELHFNPMFLARYPYAEFTALVISEILRLVYNHPAVFGEMNSANDPRDHAFLEKGSSASVSGMVQEEVRLDKNDRSKTLRLPPDAYTSAKVNQETGKTPKNNSSIDYYYKFLKMFSKEDPSEPNSPNNKQSPPMKINQPSTGQGSSDSGQPDPNAPATQNNQNGQQPHQWEKVDSQDVNDRIKGLISDVYNKMDEKSRGLMPAGVQEQIKHLLRKPEISWKQILKKYLGSVPVPYRRTRTRLNRRQPFRSDLSGKLPKRHIELVVAIDTSGSMSNSDIEYVINEIFNIVKDYDTKVTIIECDAEIGQIYVAKHARDVKTKVTGRGGTSFIPVINHINETNQYRNALMIYFTDGFGDSQIPKPRTLRNLWVVLQDEKNLSLKEPYGEVKALKKDADWIKLNKSKDGFF